MGAVHSKVFVPEIERGSVHSLLLSGRTAAVAKVYKEWV